MPFGQAALEAKGVPQHKIAIAQGGVALGGVTCQILIEQI